MMLDGNSLVISEFLASNRDGLADEDGDFSDWIEVHNPTDGAISLDDWYLTDDRQELTKWQFPDVSLDPGDYLVVFASEKDRRVAGSELHTNFALANGGEYLAVVESDGTTVAHEYAPEFPEQYEDFSYGLNQGIAAFVAEGAELTYLVPTDGSLETTWTASGFDDSTWFGNAHGSPILITEAATGTPDYVEIQSVSAGTVNTSGWVVAINHPAAGGINGVDTTFWHLPDTIAAGEVLYLDDSVLDDEHWGSDGIAWPTRGSGWVMIVDDLGRVADFVVWGYDPVDIASLDVTINGIEHITVGGAWSGAQVPADGDYGNSLQRQGDADHNDASDWGFVIPQSGNAQNVDLTVPFAGQGPPPTTGIGYNRNWAGFQVTFFQANTTVPSLATAYDVIDNPAMQTYTLTEVTDVINYMNTGDDGHYSGNRPFPSTTIGQDANYFAVEATATVIIPEAGPWTFGVNSDDGFGLELTNGTDSFYSSFPGLRGPGDTLATFNVAEPGAYDLRLVAFENEGGASAELFAAKGNYAAFSTSAFDLVGDTANGGLFITGFGSTIQTDVEAEMYDVGASIYLRIPFYAGDPSILDSMHLDIKYNDGFVAYLNGQVIASRNAPTGPQWDSTATAPHSIEDSLEYEQINVTGFLGALQAGRNMLAIHGLNYAADDEDFLILPVLTASSTDTQQRYFADPTPYGPNGIGFMGFVEDTTFTVDRGFFDEQFMVGITSDTPGATIRYTTDGSVPTETTGFEYAGPITIGTTATLRAVAFKPEHHATNVDTQTYIFLDDVIQQPSNPPGLPSTWGVIPFSDPPYSFGEPVPANYEMDPQVVDHPSYTDTIMDDLRSIPTMSLVMDPDGLWDDATGIYDNPMQEGVAWERPASVELIDADGQTLFQVDAGVRIHGGWGRRPQHNGKHSFRLLFKRDYGPPTLEYPLFGDDATDEFDTVVLRAGFNDSWATTWGESRTTYLHDGWAAQTQLEMGGLAPHGTFVHLYVNGLYWGLYNPVERPNAAFAASYLGGEKEEYDCIKIGEVIDGDANAWNALINLIRQPTIDYAAVQQMLDVSEFANYLVLHQYGGNWDWPQNNWYATRKREDGAQWRFHSWDSEGCLWDLNASRLERGGDYWDYGPGEIYLALREIEEFRMIFADRVHRHLFNAGLLTPDANISRLETLAASIDRAIVGESARWGDGRLDNINPARTRDGNWIPRLNYLTGVYFPQRTAIVLQQYRNAGLYPALGAPEMNQFGGDIVPGFQLVLTNPNASGTLYYMLDGSDPRLPGGGTNPQAQTYGGPVTLGDTTLVKARVYSGGQWSALTEALFIAGQIATAENLVVTELNYNPYEPTEDEWGAGFTHNYDFEFVELQNVSATPIDLTGAAFTEGIDFAFDTIPFLEATFDADTEGFSYADDAFGTANPGFASGNYEPSGGVVGGALRVFLGPGDTQTATSGAWSQTFSLSEADTIGVSLQFRMIMGEGYESHEHGEVVLEIDGTRYGSDVNNSLVHRVGDGAGGGEDDTGWLTTNLSIPLSAGDHTLTVGAYNNRASQPDEYLDVFIDNVTATDSAGQPTLGPGEYVLVVKNPAAFALRYSTDGVFIAGYYDGKLNDGGERIRLVDRFGEPIFDFEYGDSKVEGWPDRADGTGASLELIAPSAVPLTESQRKEFLQDGANWRSSSELGGSPGWGGDGPMDTVAVSEALSHTDYPLVDMIELVNMTAEAIDIGGWWLSDDSDDFEKFQIPAGTTIPGFGHVVFSEGHYVADGPDWVIAFDPLSEFGGDGEKDFGLSGAQGDDVWLTKGTPAGATHFVDHVEFGAALGGESFGRWQNSAGKSYFYPMTERTLEPPGPNSGPRIGPKLIISEVMYRPPDPGDGHDPDDLEFIEVYNRSHEAVTLTDWRLGKGIDFDFAADTTLDPGEALVVVRFDPVAEPAKEAYFRTHYGIADESLQIVGGHDDKLDNDGERVQLQDWDEPTLVGDPPVWITPHPLEDEVDYKVTWYAGANGGGDSLSRLGSNLWGDDPESWTAATPSPGVVTMAARIDGRYVFYNDSAFDTGPDKTDDDAIAPDKQALLPGQTASFANYTSYTLGINGIIVDVFDLKDPDQLGLDDFCFHVGNSDDPSTWAETLVADNEDPEPVWGNGYVGVWHLAEDSSTDLDNYRDSTGNENHGQLVDVNSNTTREGGMVYTGVCFFGDSDYINCGNDASLDITGTSDTGAVPVAAHPSYYEAWPAIAQDSLGNLYVTYRTATANRHSFHASGKLVMRKSTDGGLTWGPEVTVSDEPDLDDLHGGLVVFGDHGAETILATYMTRNAESVYRSYCRRSTDGGATWGPAVPISHGQQRCATGGPILLSNGEILAPLYDMHVTSYAAKSSDGGETWSEYTVTTATGDETSFVELKTDGVFSGRLCAITRDNANKRFYKTYSDDYGETWAETAVESGLPIVTPGTYSATFCNLLRMSDDSIVAAYTRDWPLKESAIYRSTDECATWDQGTPIIGSVSRSFYPSLVEIDSTHLGVVWCTNSWDSDVYYSTLDHPTTPYSAEDILTLEAWVKRDAADSYSGVVAKDDPDGDSYMLRIESDGRAQFASSDVQIWSTPAMNDTDWHHLAVTLADRTAYFYVDGELMGSGMAGSVGSSLKDTLIGARYQGIGLNDFFRGSIDEVRISDVARSADWFAFQYANVTQEDHELTWGPEQVDPASGGRFKTIAIEDDSLEQDLQDFPCYVEIDADPDIGGVGRSDGHDLRFTLEDGRTPLEYEREYWNVSDGVAAGHLWVKIPSILASGGATIRCYYGDPLIPQGITVRAGAGQDGSDRVVLTWGDNAIQNQWLEVTMLANDTTGLAEPDVFYFGNAIGETGDSPAHARVDAYDILQTRNHPHPFFKPADIDCQYDFNRDQRVDATDILIARNSQTTYSDELNLIDLPGTKASRPATRSDIVEKAPVDSRASTHDAVLERAVQRQWSRPTHPQGKMDWLWQFELVSARDRLAKSIEPAERAVDLLWATGRP